MLIEYTRNGRRRTVNAKVGKLLISRKLAREVDEEAKAEAPATNPGYSTRMLTAEPPASAPDPAAPYGYKADGTPRKRPAPRPRTPKADETD